MFGRNLMGLCAATVAVLLAVSGCAAVAKEALTLIAIEAIDHAPFMRPIGDHGPVEALEGGGTRSGGTAGLYGGTRGKASCDKKKLVRYLSSNTSKRKAWTETLGIGPADLVSFIASLTPVLLRTDTLVRNHGYERGKATAFNSVLQAGLAVLIDSYGQPVVLCRCGNPLTEAAKEVDYDRPSGKRWRKNYSAATTTRVARNLSGRVLKHDTPLEKIQFQDAGTDDLISRPLGTDGDDDVLEPAAPDPASPSSGATGNPSGAAGPEGQDPGKQDDPSESPPEDVGSETPSPQTDPEATPPPPEDNATEDGSCDPSSDQEEDLCYPG